MIFFKVAAPFIQKHKNLKLPLHLEQANLSSEWSYRCPILKVKAQVLNVLCQLHIMSSFRIRKGGRSRELSEFASQEPLCVCY